MKKNKVLIVVWICLLLTCTGCKEIPEEQKTDKDGVISMIATVSDVGEDILNCILYNKTEKNVSFGDPFFLQLLEDESYIDISTIPERGGFDAIGRILLPDGEYSYTIDLKHIYGDLESGHYRIVKDYCYEEEKKQENQTYYTVTAEFDLL